MIAGYELFDALGLADLVRRREVSAIEVLETALDRISRRNSTLNAIVTPLYDQAMADIEAGIPDGPFAGVPYVFKELLVSVRGAPTTAGSRLLAGNMPKVESEIVARCRRAGLVIVGKTNSCEFGLLPTTEPVLYGPTRNPWDLELSPGGSSGGSTAAVAAGMLPMGHATDGGGSIRIPASCCGLFGLKPTRGRITAGPEGGEGLAGFAVQHAVTWSVRDSAALLDVTAGSMPGDAYSAAPPVRPYLEEVGRDPGRLRIAFSTRVPGGERVDPRCAAATLDAAHLCEELGHLVEEAEPDFDFEAMNAGFATVFAANTAAGIDRIAGGDLPGSDLLEPLTRALAERGRTITASAYIRELQSIQRQSRRIAGFFEHHDLWLTPTLALPPRPLGWFPSDHADVDAWMERHLAFTPFTALSNATGQPAMSVPLGQTENGLPIGCHFAARYGEEDVLFRLAGQLERARPWRSRRPQGFV